MLNKKSSVLFPNYLNSSHIYFNFSFTTV